VPCSFLRYSSVQFSSFKWFLEWPKWLTSLQGPVSNVQLDENIRMWLLEEEGFKSAPETWKCRRRNGSPFQIRGPETLKVGLPTVDSRNFGTTRRLELTERSARRPCRSATRSSGQRYRGAVSCRTLYVNGDIVRYDTIRNKHACAQHYSKTQSKQLRCAAVG